MQSTPDEVLIGRIANGDRLAMQVLYARYHVRVFRFVVRLVRDEATAEDVISEVFLDVWRQAGRFEARSTVSTWLLAIARFKAVCRQSISDSWLGNLRECLAHLVKGSGCDCQLMQAASLLDGFSFDLFPPFKNGLTAPEVDVSRGDHRDRGSCILRGQNRWRSSGRDQVGLETHQLGRQRREAIGLTFRRAIVDDEVSTFNIAEFPQPLPKGVQVCRVRDLRCRLQHANAIDLRDLLRVRRERPRGRTAEQRDELTPLHSITSSARPDTGSGTVTPSALWRF